MSQTIDKGPGTLILLLVAFGITGVGVSLEGKVMPRQSSAEAIAATTTTHAQQVTESVGSAIEPTSDKQQNRQVAKANRNQANHAEMVSEQAIAN